MGKPRHLIVKYMPDENSNYPWAVWRVSWKRVEKMFATEEEAKDYIFLQVIFGTKAPKEG